MSSSDSTLLGVVVLVRHGDRQGFYQNPNTYTPSNTAITPLGNTEEFQLGTYLRSRYLDTSSPSYIQGVPTDIADINSIKVRADAGGEGGVIFNSAISLLQGLYPATTSYNTTLANGTTIVAPLSGYQTIPVESVEPEEDISLEGWTECTTFSSKTTQFYNSAAFKAKAAASANFLSELPQYLDGRSVKLENMWNIFDYMNVQNIHNATFANNLPDGFLEQARDLANYHEYGVFTDSKPDGVGNIAGLTILPSIVEGLQAQANKSGPLFVYEAISYKPITTLFNLTGAAEADPSLAAFPNYAGAIAFELRSSPSGGEPVVRFNFKNGTGADFVRYNILGSSDDIPLSTFTSKFQNLGIESLDSWCSICGQTTDRGCAELYKWQAYVDHNPISRVGAGFLGAGLTLAVALIALGLLTFLGCATFGRRGRKEKLNRLASDHGSVGSTEKRGLHRNAESPA